MLGFGWPSGATSGFGNGYGSGGNYSDVLAQLQAQQGTTPTMAPSGPTAPMANMIGQTAPAQGSAGPDFSGILKMLMAQQGSAASGMPAGGFPTGATTGNGLPPPHPILQNPVVQQILTAMMTQQPQAGGGGSDGGGSGGDAAGGGSGDTGSAGQG